MARVVIAQDAADDLVSLIRSHGLPASTRERVRRSIEPLATFPLLGLALEGRWDGFRFLIGPWPWLLIVYAFDADADLVVVVAFEDARTSDSSRSAE